MQVGTRQRIMLNKTDFSPDTNRITADINLIKVYIIPDHQLDYLVWNDPDLHQQKTYIFEFYVCPPFLETQRRRVILVPQNLALKGLISQGFFHPKPSFSYIRTIMDLRTLPWVNNKTWDNWIPAKIHRHTTDEGERLRSNTQNRIQEAGWRQRQHWLTGSVRQKRWLGIRCTIIEGERRKIRQERSGIRK